MNIGLILSGGMAKGAYQIGALKAINNFIPRNQIKHISCASVGVLNGYAYITNQLDKAQSMWLNLCCDENRMYINKLLRSSLLQQNIKQLLEANTNIQNIDFYCTLLDAKHKSIVYKNLLGTSCDNTLSYLKASISMPLYNKAVCIDNVPYYDGAIIDNIPVYPLMKHKLDYIICIYFDDICYKFENTYFDNKTIKIIFPSKNIFKQSLIFNTDNIKDMIKTGFENTSKLLEVILNHGYDNLEHIYNSIEDVNRTNTPILRITSDVLMTNINKITQKFSKKAVIQEENNNA